MKKFRCAVFCFLLTGFDRGFYSWMLMLAGSKRVAGHFTIGSDSRLQVAEWARDLLNKELDPDTIIRLLIGDAFFDRNKSDIAKLERVARKSVFELWDTDPIFAKFSHLRGLARNREFEEMWAKEKKVKSR
ncbi:MAG: hypothetical protein LBJ18_02185 [Rickettsiales bacterium]|nr:hypothetical protein [Rickettsiales bacterium]